MQEVVKKEIIKWLDTGVVYPITDSKLVSPVQCVPKKRAKSDFDEKCRKAFDELKVRLMSAPIIVSPDFSQPFELICDTSDFFVGVVLGQRHNKIMHLVYYSSKMLNAALMNYTITKQERLAIIFAFTKFKAYLLGSKVKDRKGSENEVADHLSRLEEAGRQIEELDIGDVFPDKRVLAVSSEVAPWYADIANFLVTDLIPDEIKT
ncbi:uncharacterized protein LOC132612010 [Lycium barbarum]|uniref:uncharacterized protein LOC132612010 n=1 Tax=Lycium barbarum TaxID=112863 RepID=UPI00293EE57A|nr:uncharacterized protein LOC132612010 [Lycium barbarum]